MSSDRLAPWLGDGPAKGLVLGRHPSAVAHIWQTDEQGTPSHYEAMHLLAITPEEVDFTFVISDETLHVLATDPGSKRDELIALDARLARFTVDPGWGWDPSGGVSLGGS